MSYLEYDFSSASMAAYYDLYGDFSEKIKNNLIQDGMSEWQVNEFFRNFGVKYGRNDRSGLNAYLLDDPSSGMTVAFRGTEFSFSDPEQGLASLLDILNDGGLHGFQWRIWPDLLGREARHATNDDFAPSAYSGFFLQTRACPRLPYSFSGMGVIRDA